jgi:hydrogenase/urease accessory protein HupE
MLLWILCVDLFLAAAGRVCAHDPGLSALSLRLEKDKLEATLTLARADAEALAPLDADHDGKVSQQEFEAIRSRLELIADTALELKLDGTLIPGGPPQAELDPSDAVHFRFVFSGVTGGRFSVRSTILSSLPRGHREYLTLRDARDRLLGDRMLDAKNDSFDVQLPAMTTATASHSPSSRPFSRFLLLGIEHIATGYDHLVFLLGLLIVGARFRDVVKIITSFTMAHSFTLALATLDVIRLSSRVVEPLIAVSIMYVGIENLLRGDLQRRWLLAFGFGLIHGCGFASALRDAGLGANGSSVGLPLFSFNLGVELGQLTLAALVLPVIWKLKERPSFQPRVVPICSVVVALAGGYWLAMRTVFG